MVFEEDIKIRVAVIIVILHVHTGCGGNEGTRDHSCVLGLDVRACAVAAVPAKVHVIGPTNLRPTQMVKPAATHHTIVQSLARESAKVLVHTNPRRLDRRHIGGLGSTWARL